MQLVGLLRLNNDATSETDRKKQVVYVCITALYLETFRQEQEVAER